MSATTIQLRRNTAANWTTKNPLLQAGEMGVELDTKKVKVGDGTTLWNSLPYVGDDTSSIAWGNISGTLSNQTDLQQALDAKQNEIKSDNKLSSDLVDDTNHTNKFVTENEKTTWSNKQNAITSSSKLSSDLVDDTNHTNKFVTASDKTTWSNKQEALVSGTNIKTINNNSLLGSGNITVKTYQEFPEVFVTSGTLQEVVVSMMEAEGYNERGMAYLGGISGECMPWVGGGNAECKVEYFETGMPVLTLCSSNVPPYRWEYHSYNNDYKWKKAVAQMEVMPTDNLDLAVGIIVQYIGTTDTDYTNGYFYKCVQNGGNYSWQQMNTQPHTPLTWGNITGTLSNQTDLNQALEGKQPTITNLSTIESNAQAGKNASDTIATYGTIVTHGEGDYLLATTKYGATLTMTIDSSTYVITTTLKDQDGNTLGTAQTVDLPLETVVVSGRYDTATKQVILTLKNGSEIKFSVADLVSGLQSEITTTNKLSSDLVDDTNHTNKFVTASDKTTWSNKQEALVSGTNIKTINGSSVLGNGNLTVKTYQQFPSDFKTSGTLQQIVESIRSSSGAKQGMAYLGGISGNCMPWGIGNAECKVEYMTDTIAVMTLNSSNHPPYTWIYNTDVSDYKWKQQIGQYTSNLPTKDVPAGTVVQYAGDTNSTYTKGYFYKATVNGNDVTWSQIDVQPETTLPVSTNTTVMNNSAFEVTDNSGNVALQVDNQGNLRTSKFRSDITPKTGNTLTSGGAFEISDSDGNVAFKIDETGNIITKNFNSSLTTTNAVKSINNINGALTLNPIMGIYNKEISILANTRHVNPIIVDNFTQSSHRGAPDKTNNTIEAFELSRTRGFKMIECDVRYTSDDVFVLFHDETIGGKAISSYTWSELHTAYNYIPTVEETLKWAKAYGICVEFDCATRLGNKVTSFYNLIKKWRMLPNCMICGIESELVTLADIGLTDIPVVISLWGNLPTQANLEALSPKLKKFNAAFVSIDKDDLVTYTTAPDICHTLGYSVKSFTPTTKADTKTLFNMGVDMINVDATELWDIYTN